MKTLFCFSSYNKEVNQGNSSVVENLITNKKININFQSREYINKILGQQLKKIEEKKSLIIAQIVLAELLYRGIIIPISNKDNEEEYLQKIVNFNTSYNSFFMCNKIKDEAQLLEFNNYDQNRIIFCGIPYDITAKNPGTRFGPQLLRNQSVNKVFRSRDHSCLLNTDNNLINIFNNIQILDIGDINLRYNSINECIDKVKNISELVSRYSIPFFVGGDHSFTYPIVSGIFKARKSQSFTFIQFDQHLDIQIWGEFNKDYPKKLDTLTHANFVSWINKEMPQIKILQIGIEKYLSVSPENSKQVIQYLNNIGSRISNNAIFTKPHNDICALFPKNQDIYISIDVDVLSSVYISATGYPALTGISLKKMLLLLMYLVVNNNIIGVDIMEYGQTNDKYSDKVSRMSNLVIKLILEIIESRKK